LSWKDLESLGRVPFSDDLAGGSDGCPIVGADLTELIDIAGDHCIPHILFEVLDRVDGAEIFWLSLRGNKRR
jgi:hypothetical protein